MISLQALRRAGLLLLYFARFAITTVPAQAVLALLFMIRPTVPRKVWAYVLLIALYWMVVLVMNPSAVPLKNALFYFSFLLPMLLLVSARSHDGWLFVSDRFIVVVCILTIVEAIVLNSPLAGLASYLLPAGWSTSSENVRLFGFYQRPLGIAGNASMTSGVLVFAAVLGDSVRRYLVRGIDYDGTPVAGRVFATVKYRTLLLASTLLILASGAGFGLMIAYFTWRSFADFRFTVRRVALAALILAIPAAAIISAFFYLNNIAGFQKFGSTYALRILDMKMTAAGEAFGPGAADHTIAAFGDQVSPATLAPDTSGDFGFLGMYSAMGVLGALTVLLAPLLFWSALRRFRGALLFFYLSFVHYPGLLSPPGAVLFGVFLYTLFEVERLENLAGAVSRARYSALIPAAQ